MIVISPSTCAGDRPEVIPLDDVNEHTSGREYYGRSSKFALLGQLFVHARSGAFTSGVNAPTNQELYSGVGDGNRAAVLDERVIPQETAHPATKNRPKRKSTLTHDRLSIVNLLYDDESSGPDTNADAAFSSAEGSQSELAAPIRNTSLGRKAVNSTRLDAVERPSITGRNDMGRNPRPQRHKRIASTSVGGGDYFGKSIFDLSMEKEHMRVFFSNLHYIHPFLSYGPFAARCDTTIWARWPLTRIPRQEKHFLALYNVVLAVGSLIGSLDTFSAFKKQWEADEKSVHSDVSNSTSTLQLSKIFFNRSKRLLGDCFEVCTLESAQTLVLMVKFHPMPCFLESRSANIFVESHCIAKMR